MRLPCWIGRRRTCRVAARSLFAAAAATAAVSVGIFSVVAPRAFATASRTARQAPPTPAAATPVSTTSANFPNGAASVQATWDEDYVYFAFQVADANILGTNNAPMSHPEKDDSVGVYFQASPAGAAAVPTTPDTDSHAMLVSVAGGFTFLQGDPASKAFAPKPTFSIKYGVTTEGTLNRSDDRDHSFTITLAVPWDALGMDPKTLKNGREIGFNAVARSREGGDLTAFAPGVTTEADAANPSKWAKLVLAGPDGTGAKAGAGVLVAQRVPNNAHAPLIDGVFRPAEWPPASTRVVWASPDKAGPEVVVAPARPADFTAEDSVAPALRFDQPLGPMQKLVMARYRIDYQADRRKVTIPQRNVFGAGDTLLLRDQPATGLGPWFSADRTSYERSELAALRHSGIDVALIEVGGPDGTDALLDEKALLVLVTSLREMTAAGTPTPLIAPLFDLSRVDASSPTVDLATAKGRDHLYAAIRRWMRIVPPEYRLRVTLPETASPSGALVTAYPTFLEGDATKIVQNVADPLWTDTLRDRFAKEYGPLTGGATLLFTGVGPGWDAAAPKVVASLGFTPGKGTGRLTTYLISPGCAAQPFVPRADGATYKKAWDDAIAAQPTWILLDSWNDFSRGTEVTASRQYGPRYSDLTRIYTIQAAGLPARAVRWLANDAPRRVRPGQVVATTVTVQNVGTTILRGDEGIALTYRWRQNGKVVAEGPLRIPLAGALLPTQTANLPVGIVAAMFDAAGHAAPLPPGEYVVEIDLAQVTRTGITDSVKYFGETEKNSPSLRIGVTVAADVPDYVQIAGTTTPELMVAGNTYPGSVRVRWMGTETLQPENGSLLYQILTQDGKTTIRTGSAKLPGPLTPGLWITVPTKVETAEAGVAIAPAYPEQMSPDAAAAAAATNPAGTLSDGYRIRWLLTRTSSTEPVPGEYDEQVAVYPTDDVAVVAAPPPPAKGGRTMDAFALVPMSVTLFNTGATTWKQDAYAVGYHWYDPDGVEASWRPVTSTGLTKDVAPGESLTMDVNVRAPRRDGTYILAFDLLRLPDAYLSTRPVTSSSDLGVTPVRVSGGNLTFLDLEKEFNTVALATDAQPKLGNLDGSGDSFPAESFPPDRFGIVAYLAPDPDLKTPKFDALTAYPSGYYAQSFSAARETSFKFGADAGGDGAKTAVACAGQTIVVPKSHYYGLHFAATATGGADRPLTVTLHYHTGATATVTRTLHDWNALPSATDAVAVGTIFKRTPAGDQSVPCSVWHVVLPVEVSRELESITLPNDGAIKVFAITLERQ